MRCLVTGCAVRADLLDAKTLTESMREVGVARIALASSGEHSVASLNGGTAPMFESGLEKLLRQGLARCLPTHRLWRGALRWVRVLNLKSSKIKLKYDPRKMA